VCRGINDRREVFIFAKVADTGTQVRLNVSREPRKKQTMTESETLDNVSVRVPAAVKSQPMQRRQVVIAAHNTQQLKVGEDGI
jgi:hypothetical protein